MSFGFGVGDFIAVAEKAWKVYERCKDASDDYAELSVSVQVLALVLDQSAEFVRRGKVPDDCLKKDAFAAARESCRATLTEVEAFLDKHSGMKKEKRFFEIVRFIRHDIKGYKSRLESHRDLVQLSLTSLSSLSIMHVEQQLVQIVKEYKSGTRERTVITDAIQDNNNAPEPELFDQLVIDLEDKDVHPDAISFNAPFILSWLKRIIETNELAEAEQRQPQDQEIAVPAAVGPPSGPALCHGIEAPSGEGPPPIQELRLTEGPSNSRPASASSHRSKPDTWHPSDLPDPEYVQNMLEPFFQGGLYRHVFDGAERERLSLRCTRAYRQLDYSDRGYVTRNTVLEACQQALDRAGIPFDQGTLGRLISSHDANQDGRFDLEEFLTLIENLATRATESLRGFLDQQLLAYRRRAEKKWFISNGDDVAWPFVRVANSSGTTGSERLYRNVVLDSVDQKHRPLHQTSFTRMALSANSCMNDLESLESMWRPIVPKSLSSRFFNSFETIRSAILRYTLFEHPQSDVQHSDLDDIAAQESILLIFKSKDLHQLVDDDFDNIRRGCYEDLVKIQSLVVCLEEIRRNLGPIIQAHHFQQLNSYWESKHVNDMVYIVSQDLNNWDRHRNVVQRYRSEPPVRRRWRAQEALLLFRKHLAYTPWTLLLKTATVLSDPLDRKTFMPRSFKFSRGPPDHFQVSVRIDDSAPGHPAKLPDKDIVGRDFMFEHHYIVYPNSTMITLLKFPQMDEATAKTTARFDFPFLTRDQKVHMVTLLTDNKPLIRLNFESTGGELPLVAAFEGILGGCGPYCPVMQDTERSHNSLRIQQQLQVGLSLGPGIEKRMTPEGKEYYVDHNQRTTSWILPVYSSKLAELPVDHILPPHWTIERDSGRRSYVHLETQERLSEPPPLVR